MENTTPKIFESEYRFCLILWEKEPVSRSELAAVCKEKLGWSRTTTYTVISRLAARGVLTAEAGAVRSLVSKEEVQRAEMGDLLEKRFEGSLPAFIAAFTKVGKISERDAEEIKRMLEQQ